METTLSKVFLASTMVVAYYNKLKTLSLNDEEDTKEYYRNIKMLKAMIKTEREIYQELNQEDITKITNHYQETGINSLVDKRVNIEVANIGNNEPYSLNTAISTKLLLDVIKLLEQKISTLQENDELTEDDIINLHIHNSFYKYGYLSSNPQVEDIALDHKFTISSLPNISFESIEKEYNITFIKESQSLFINYINESISELIKIKASDIDEFEKQYLTLLEISRIETIIPYLDIKSLNIVLKEITNIKGNKNLINNIKRLIYQKKEELFEDE